MRISLRDLGLDAVRAGYDQYIAAEVAATQAIVEVRLQLAMPPCRGCCRRSCVQMRLQDMAPEELEALDVYGQPMAVVAFVRMMTGGCALPSVRMRTACCTCCCWQQAELLWSAQASVHVRTKRRGGQDAAGLS